MKEKGAMKSIWHFLKEMWECSYDYLESVAEFLTRRKWWFIAILFFLIFIPVFLTFHYEKGLGVGDALFFTFAIIFGATIVAIIVVFSLIWLLMLTGRVIRYFKKENQAQPEEKEEKKVASPKELGPIDEERLAPYFKSTFKGMGGGQESEQIQAGQAER